MGFCIVPDVESAPKATHKVPFQAAAYAPDLNANEPAVLEDAVKLVILSLLTIERLSAIPAATLVSVPQTK